MVAVVRGNSWQGVVYHRELLGGRTRRNFATREAAEDWEQTTKLWLRRGRPLLAEAARRRPETHPHELPYTLGDLVAHVSSCRWKGTAAHRSQSFNAKEIVALIGAGKPVKDLNKADIDRARRKLLDRGNQPSTVNRKVASLSTCLSEARDMGLIATKPRCAKYRECDHRVRRFSLAEEADALQYFKLMGEPDMVDFIVISLDTGLRQGEMLKLKYRDVDGQLVAVWGTNNKSGKTRSVPLTRRAKGILAARQERLEACPGDLVFPMTRYALSWQWEKLTRALGVEGDKQFVPHILRHEFCSRLAERDLSAVVIQQLAGHSCLSVTQRYVHLRAEHLVRAIKALEAPLAPAFEAHSVGLPDTPARTRHRAIPDGHRHEGTHL